MISSAVPPISVVAVTAITSAIARPADLKRRDTHVPRLLTVVRKLKSTEIAYIPRCRAACPPEIRVVEELDLGPTEDLDRADSIVQTGWNGCSVLSRAQAKRFAPKVVIREKA